MKIPTVRLVFDRKKIATKSNKGLIQLEFTYERKRKWLSSGIKVYSDQWHPRKWVVNSPDRIDVNENLREQVLDWEKWLRDNFSIKGGFTWDKLEQRARSLTHSGDFIAFVEEAINGRNDLRASTQRVHRKLITILREFGGIRTFNDLHPSAIMDFDAWLHGRRVRKLDKNGVAHMVPMRPLSLYDYHKTLKTYINFAVRRGFVDSNPYNGLRFKRGESEPDRYLTEDELRQLEQATMPNGSLTRAKDMFLFQCYTGLSYADLCEFDFSKAKDSGDVKLYTGRRVKTGHAFYFVLLPKALEILKKYEGKLPITCLVVLNRNLKKVAEIAGIGKPIATHWARRTAAMIFANHGVRIEVVAKILGHTSTVTTQRFYASITAQTVANEMLKAVQS